MSPPGEPPLDPELSRRGADSRRRPETEFPAVVPVGTLQFDRTEPTAIAVTCVLAYSNGFEFFVTRVLRPDGPRFGLGAGPAPPHLRTGRTVNQSLEIGVEFADGGRFFATDTPPLDDEDATGPVLHFGGVSAVRTGRTTAGGSGHCRQAVGWTSSPGLKQPNDGSAWKRS